MSTGGLATVEPPVRNPAVVVGAPVVVYVAEAPEVAPTTVEVVPGPPGQQGMPGAPGTIDDSNLPDFTLIFQNGLL